MCMNLQNLEGNPWYLCEIGRLHACNPLCVAMQTASMSLSR